MTRTILIALAMLAAAPAAADEFVDVLGKVWARKGGLACGSANAAAANEGGFFSGCERLRVAIRLQLVDMPEPATQVYYMRVLGAGETPKYAWFSRESLTNNPTPGEFVPDP